VRLAILSDIHEDYKGLKRVFKRIGRIGYDSCICLGDISGYSEAYYRYPKERNARACLELVRKHCDIIIPGNHDLHAAGRIPLPGEGAGPDHWPHEEDLDPGYSREDLAFLAGLPEYAVLPDTTYKILLSHYVDPNLSGIMQGFFTRGKEFASHFGLMERLGCKLGISGHAHARGVHLVYPDQFRHYGYSRAQLKDFPVVVGIPPVTRHKMRSGFCIFDTDTHLLQAIKLF
jgi:predicted phosphodiesterase